jgi:hypothetical protein
LKRRWPILVLGAAIVASSLLLLHLGRGQTLIVDQWGYLFAYRSWAPHSLLTPHTGHLIALPLIVYKAMFATFGIDSHLPYQLVNLALSATVSILLFTLIRRAVGDLIGLAAAILILFYGAGGDVILPTFQYPNLIGLASGLGLLLALQRQDVRGDVGACALLAASLASFTIGVAFAAGAAVMLAFRPPARRLRACWVIAIPVLAYAAWVLWARKYGQQTIYVHNLKIIGSAVADQLGAVLAGLTGLFTTPNGPPPEVNTMPIRTSWAPALVVGLAAILIVRLRRPPAPSASALAATAVLVVYFLLVGIALNSARNTFDTRLVYLGSVLTLLAVAELVAPFRPGRTTLVIVAVVFVVSMCANIAELGDGARALRAESASNRAKLAAAEVAGQEADMNAVIEKPPADMAFTVGTYEEIKNELGTPAFSEGELRSASPSAREDTDAALVRFLGVAPERVAPLKPFSAAQQVHPSIVAKGVVRRRKACISLKPRLDSPMEVVLRVPTGGIAYSSAGPLVRIVLGRFADATHVKLPTESGSFAISVPPDRSRTPWVASVRTDGRTLVCPAEPLA